MKTEDLKLFHQIVESGSMTQTSESLNLPMSSLSRRLKKLEDELNMPLFHRQRRTMLLTDAGATFYEETKPLLNQLELTVQKVRVAQQEITGNLRIQTLAVPGMFNIGQLIFRFMDHHPKVRVEMISTTEDKNLVENHIDVAFRIGSKIHDQNLIARPFASPSLNLYASTSYLEKYGTPTNLSDLKQHNVIRYRYPDGHILNKISIGQQAETVEVSGNLIMNSLPSMIEACLLGRGIVYMPEQLADHYVERGELVKLFDNLGSFSGTCWLVYQPRPNQTLATRAFIDLVLSEIEKNNEFFYRPGG